MNLMKVVMLFVVVLFSFTQINFAVTPQPPQNQQGMPGFNLADSIEPVAFQNLKALLPESLPGLKRTNATGEKGNIMGMKTSKAEGQYDAENEEDYRSITISITDMGTLSGLTAMGFYWMNMEMEQESDTGYERTITYQGYPAYEQFEQMEDYSNGEITVVVGGRFVVEIRGNSVEMEQMKAALEKIDVKKLEGMK